MKTEQYNNVLMVEVPEDADDFMILTKGGEREFWKLPDNVMNRLDLYANGIYNTPVVHLNLPAGTHYSIIGKGDELSDKDWEGIVFQSKIRRFKDYTYKNQNLDEVGLLDALLEMKFESPTASGHSLLASKGFSPSTTLIIKKIDK